MRFSFSLTCSLVTVLMTASRPLEAAIVTETECSVTTTSGTLVDTGSRRCEARLTMFTFAEANADYTIDSSHSDLVFILTPTTHVFLNPEEALGLSARADVTVDLVLTTAGPVRPGLLQIGYDAQVIDHRFGTSGSVQVADLFSAEYVDGLCTGCTTGVQFPVMLGQPFPVHMHSSVLIELTRGGGEPSVTLVVAALSLLATDPAGNVVQIQIVPEPATYVLLGCGLCAVGFSRYRLARSSTSNRQARSRGIA